MPRGLQFGRRIRIRVGNQIVTDVDPAESFEVNEARTLDATFSTESHVKLEPLMTTVTVRGLNRQSRRQLTSEQDAAAKIAWEEYQDVQSGLVNIEDDQITQFQQQLVFQGGIVTIEAGYEDDFALIAKAQILPDGIEHEYDGSGYVTTIRAQDTRYPWQNAFVSETVAPGVTIRDLQAVLQFNERFLTGDATQEEVIAAQTAGLLESKNFGGYANGRVLHGDSRNFEQEIAERLGYRRFLDRGVLRFIRADSVTFDEAVVLRLVPKRDTGQIVPGGLLRYKELKRGFVEATALLNHRITAGRQVFLQDEDSNPIGEGAFRVDYVRHVGSNFEATYNSEMTLRPIKVALTRNV